MKKTLVAFTLLFLTLITNAQTLEGKWKFEKVKLCGILIYFDDTDKDKENLIKAQWICYCNILIESINPSCVL